MAIVKVTIDLWLPVNRGDSLVLVLWDWHCLEMWVGIKGSPFGLLRSHLCNKTFSISLGNSTSLTTLLSCGVPQGSVIGPFLFTIYTLPPVQVNQSHRVHYQMYPKYISDPLTWYVPSWLLSVTALLVTPSKHFVTKGDKALAIRAPKLRKSLLIELRPTQPCSFVLRNEIR